MTRKEGFIDIDKMLQDIGIDTTNIYNILGNPLVTSFNISKGDILLQFSYNGTEYFYKYKKYSMPYNELVASELAQDFGICHINYDLAILNDKKGVLSNNFKKNNATYVTGEEILLDYWRDYKRDEWDIEHHNNLEDIWDALAYRYHNHPNKQKLVEHLMKKIVSVFMFDIITCQYDRHSLNWEIEESDNLVDVVPIYDNERILSTNGKNAVVSLTISDGKRDSLLHNLKLFLKASGDNYHNFINAKMWIISDENLQSVFKRIEDKTGYPMSQDKKDYYLKEFKSHRKRLETIIIPEDVTNNQIRATMSRKEGFIDVDKMLQEIGVDTTNIDKIKENSLITCHYHIGNDLLMEFKYDNESYLFKYKSSSIPYNELIAYELATDFGISCAEYDLAILLDMEGVIVKNYKKEGYNYLSGEQILLDYWKDYEIDMSFHNNLEDIWDALEYRYQTHPNKMEIVEHLMNKIVSIFIFDIITCQADRHSLNWEIEESNDSIDIVSLYDNEEVFTLIGKNHSILLTIDSVRRGNLIQELRLFFKTSCKDYVDLLKDKLWIISDENLVSVFNRIEVKTGYSISEIEKEYYLELCKNHKENLEKEIILYENNLESDEQNERKNR